MNNKKVGTFGENLVKKYLEKIGYKIIQTNFRCRQGEIDIIAIDKKELVFIEVKTRGNQKFGYAVEAVNKYKQSHIKRVTEYFVYKNNLENVCIRFDIIEVYFKERKYYLNHIKNVLW